MTSEENISPEKNVSGPVTRQTKLMELVRNHPDAASIISSYGMHCIGCAAAQFETIEMGCGAHGIPDDVIDEIIVEINEFIADSEKKSE